MERQREEEEGKGRMKEKAATHRLLGGEALIIHSDGVEAGGWRQNWKDLGMEERTPGPATVF